MTDIQGRRPLALVTGASTGIGYELAKQFAQHGYDLLITSDEGPKLQEAAQSLQTSGGRVETVTADLSGPEGVEQIVAKAKELGPVDALAANAGIGLGHAFLDQDLDRVFQLINVNVTSTVHLIHHVGNAMRERGQGKILITSSIAALMPGSYQAVYNASKSFLHSFSFAIRNELKDTGVGVTTLMPGATETEFFKRGDLMDTKIGQAKKDDPADVAKTGFEALMKGEGDVVHGLMNKLQAAVAAVAPDSGLAQMHRGMAEPGSGQK